MIFELVILYVTMFVMKEIEINNITIKDYSLTEQLALIRGYLKDQGVHTVSYLSSSMVMSMGDDEFQREMVRELDLVILTDAYRHSDGEAVVGGSIDGKADDFLENMLRQAAAAGEEIFIVSDSKEKLEELENALRLVDERTTYCGKCVTEKTDRDTMYNDINCRLPKFVILSMSWKMQGEIMREARRFLTVPVVLGINPQMVRNINSGHKLGKKGILDFLQIGKK